MPDVTFVHPDGRAEGFEAPDGVTLMQAATGHGVQGIVAECGGQCICATCHVYVDPDWVERLPPPSTQEWELLKFTAAERRPGSRLSCQIVLVPELQGLRVQLPDAQV